MINRNKITKNLYLKEVSKKDVNFILKLRTDKFLSKYLNYTPNNKKNSYSGQKNILLEEKLRKSFILYFRLKKKIIKIQVLQES